MNLLRQLVRSISTTKSPGNFKFETAAIRRKETHFANTRRKLQGDREQIQREVDTNDCQRQTKEKAERIRSDYTDTTGGPYEKYKWR